MSTLTKPQARIPVGWVTVAGQRLPVVIDLEWDRYLSTVTERAGGALGLSTTDVDAGSYAAMQPLVFEPMTDGMHQPYALITDQPGEICQQGTGGDYGCADLMQSDNIQPIYYLPMQG